MLTLSRTWSHCNHSTRKNKIRQIILLICSVIGVVKRKKETRPLAPRRLRDCNSNPQTQADKKNHKSKQHPHPGCEETKHPIIGLNVKAPLGDFIKPIEHRGGQLHRIDMLHMGVSQKYSCRPISRE